MRLRAVLLVLPAIVIGHPTPRASAQQAFAIQQAGATNPAPAPPMPPREFRAVWVATVNNMDWPSRPGLSTAEQRRELLAILDRAAELNLNAVIFQVRPEGDALYPSPYEPWSRYLTGEQGRAPSPHWDPLAFAVDEAHKRGLELHAWFNPFRMAFHRDRDRAASHISRQHPELVRTYAQFLWLDPGIPLSRELMLRAVIDVVRRYDVDGVHIDDYFYPYPEYNSRTGRRFTFDDDRTYDAYRRRGGQLDLADWRRKNVNDLVREFYAAVKAEKPWVRVGISPFGIWRPGVPATTTAGLDQYSELYADVRLWLRRGWLDYIAPQLYWPTEPADQSFPVLLGWWVSENLEGRHVWPGLALYKLPIHGSRRMTSQEIARQVRLTRDMPGATGHIHFNAAVMMQNVQGIADTLARLYSDFALTPPSPWLDSIAPEPPVIRLAGRGAANGDEAGAGPDGRASVRALSIEPPVASDVRYWLVQTLVRNAWRTAILPATASGHIFMVQDIMADAEAIAVTAIDRTGNASVPTVITPG